MNKKLKIGLLLDSFDLRLWEIYLIKRLLDSEYARIDLIVIKNNEKISLSFFQKIKNNWSKILFLAYENFEKIYFNIQPNAREIKDSKDLLKNIPLKRVTTNSTKYSDRFSTDDIRDINEFNLDVLIRFGFKILRGDILNSSKYGVWSFHHGDNDVNRGGPPGLWEVFESKNVTGSILQILNEDLDNGQILFKSFSATHKNSYLLNRNKILWKSASFLPRKLEQLNKLGSDKFFEIIQKGEGSLKFYSNKLYTAKAINNWYMIKYISNFIFKGLNAKISNNFNHFKWVLLFSFSDGISTSIWRFKKIIPPKDRYYADPFIIRDDDNYYIFIEEYIHNTQKGHISVIKMDKAGNYHDPVKIIDQRYHLSYPHIFYDGKEYYLVPESGANNTIGLYKCSEFPYKWHYKMTLMENLKTADSTIYFHNNKYWLFTNIIENDGASIHDELFLFHSDKLESKDWTPHVMNPIISDVRRARPAGNIFVYNGKLIRPSQDCSKRYGYGIRLNEIIILNEDEYKEVEIEFIEPNWDDSIVATHTINYNDNLTIIDALMK